jgi:hypothetical protein
MCRLVPVVLFLAACNGTVEITDDSSGGDDTGKPYEFTGPDPVIFSGDATCTGGGSWDFTLHVGDQQGADTVTSGIYIIFRIGDGAVQGDGKYDCKGGTCTGTAEGGSCSQADQYSLHFEVTDTDGNKSRALEIQGHD